MKWPKTRSNPVNAPLWWNKKSSSRSKKPKNWPTLSKKLFSTTNRDSKPIGKITNATWKSALLGSRLRRKMSMRKRKSSVSRLKSWRASWRRLRQITRNLTISRGWSIRLWSNSMRCSRRILSRKLLSLRLIKCNWVKTKSVLSNLCKPISKKSGLATVSLTNNSMSLTISMTRTKLFGKVNSLSWSSKETRLGGTSKKIPPNSTWMLNVFKSSKTMPNRNQSQLSITMFRFLFI